MVQDQLCNVRRSRAVAAVLKAVPVVTWIVLVLVVAVLLYRTNEKLCNKAVV